MSIIASYVNTTTFTVTTDLTDDFMAGRRTKANCGTDSYKYGTISGSSYSSPNTTVILTDTSNNLTSNLESVTYGIIGTGTDQSMPTHGHTTAEGDGGTVYGEAGTSGTSGSSGTSGADGTSGSSGSSGTSGAGTSGSSGSSGTSGDTGTSGSSGTSALGTTSGTSGSSGTSGVGTSGTSGSSGTSGADGTSGSSGTSGAGGTSGSSGTSGADGTSGSSGSSGSSGTSGADGTSGSSGSSGSSGTSGVDGTSGSSGSSGTSGADGTSGSSGSSGTSGADGTSGSSGTSGLANIVEDTTPQLGGNLDLNNYNIDYGSILTISGTYEGKIMTITVDDVSTVFGNPLYIESDFHYHRADADSSTSMPCRALSLESGNGSKKILLEGQVCNTDWNWNRGDVYVSTISGALTQTYPTGDGDQIQIVGWALSANTMYFKPWIDAEYEV